MTTFFSESKQISPFWTKKRVFFKIFSSNDGAAATRRRRVKKINVIRDLKFLPLTSSTLILLTKERRGVNAKRLSFRFFPHFFEIFSPKRKFHPKNVKIRGLRRDVKTNDRFFTTSRQFRRDADEPKEERVGPLYRKRIFFIMVIWRPRRENLRRRLASARSGFGDSRRPTFPDFYVCVATVGVAAAKFRADGGRLNVAVYDDERARLHSGENAP